MNTQANNEQDFSDATLLGLMAGRSAQATVPLSELVLKTGIAADTLTLWLDHLYDTKAINKANINRNDVWEAHYWPTGVIPKTIKPFSINPKKLIRLQEERTVHVDIPVSKLAVEPKKQDVKVSGQQVFEFILSNSPITYSELGHQLAELTGGSKVKIQDMAQYLKRLEVISFSRADPLITTGTNKEWPTQHGFGAALTASCSPTAISEAVPASDEAASSTEAAQVARAEPVTEVPPEALPKTGLAPQESESSLAAHLTTSAALLPLGVSFTVLRTSADNLMFYLETSEGNAYAIENEAQSVVDCLAALAVLHPFQDCRKIA